MNKPQTVICFAVNILGNDSLLLMQDQEGDFVFTPYLHPTLKCQKCVIQCAIPICEGITVFEHDLFLMNCDLVVIQMC